MDNNLVGQTIQGRYYVVKQLGRGGVGVTFLAQDQQCFDSQCVVKQLKPKSANSKILEVARRLFNREAEIMNRLGDCDRIPRLLAYFEQDNDFFLVQELIEGHDLSQEIIAGEPWSEEKTITLLRDILEVLLFVQQNSVIHRDLKPSNLMRRYKDKKIILIDFGSVKQVSTQIIDAAGQIKPTVAVGTKSYMPMEQMTGRPGFYSDIYAVGIIAIQALTGVHPQKFRIDDRGEVIWRNRLDSKLNYQPRFLDILDKMIRRCYPERYTSAGVVLSDLERLNAEENNNKETIIISSRRSSEARSPKAALIEKNETKIITPLNNHSHGAGNFKAYSEPVKPQKSQSLILPIVAGVLALFATVSGAWVIFQKDSPEPEVELSLYEDTNLGFKLDYPQTWLEQKRDDMFMSGVYFSSPLENDLDKFKERVSVSVENLSNEKSLAEYTDESLSEIKKLSDINASQAQTVNLGEVEARQVVYKSEENGNSVQRMQTWSVKDKQAYIVTYTAQPDTYDDYLPVVQKMIESFMIID